MIRKHVCAQTILMLGLAGLVTLPLLLAGCAKKPDIRLPESVLDTPQSAYERGQGQLASGQLSVAEMSFRRAVELDPKYAPGYEGLGLVSLSKGDLIAAEQKFQQALDRDGEYLPAKIGQGRVRTGQGKYEDAEGKFKDVLKKEPGNQDALYWHGKNYGTWGRTAEAMDSFNLMLEGEPGNQRATEALFDLARHGAATTGVPPEYVKIAGQSGITRQDLAALVAVEIQPERYFKTPPEATASFQTPEQAAKPIQVEDTRPEDVPADHWAAPYIESCLQAGMLDLFPGNKFLPERAVTRGDFAVALERTLVAVTGDTELQTRYVGTMSEYSDVTNDHYALNAIKVATTRGLMSADLEGKFNPTGPVSGTDALLMLNKLRELLEK